MGVGQTYPVMQALDTPSNHLDFRVFVLLDDFDALQPSLSGAAFARMV